MEELIKSYVDFLSSKMHIRALEHGWNEIITPFLNHNNDMVSIYVKKTSDTNIQLSDGGETINELELSGLNIIRSKKRLEHMNCILNSYGIDRKGNGELSVMTTKEAFPQVKHRLLQAIMAIDDMFVLTTEKVESFFVEDVENYLNLNEIMYTRDVMFMGKSKFAHNFDFSIPVRQDNKQKNFLTKAINNPRKDILKAAIFMIDDVRAIRDGIEGLFIINDEKGISDNFKSEVIEATHQYNISFIEWSDREDAFSELKIVA